MEELDINKDRVEELKSKLDPKNVGSVSKFGLEGQNKIEYFSAEVLGYVQRSGVGEVGFTIKGLVEKLDESKPEELMNKKLGFFARIFGGEQPSVYERTAKYQRIESEVDGIGLTLRMQRDSLDKDNQVLDNLYNKNLEYFKELGEYIEAGELKIEELKGKLEGIGDSGVSEEDVVFGSGDNLGNYIKRLERRVHNLKITRQITMQQAPQIRLIQETNHTLIDRIDTTVSTAIPLWKNQIAISLAMMRKSEALVTQREVNDLTRKMIDNSTKEIKEGSKEIAKEMSKSESDTKSLEKVQKELIGTLKEALDVHEEGTVKIKEAESSLGKIEQELKEQVEEVLD